MEDYLGNWELFKEAVLPIYICLVEKLLPLGKAMDTDGKAAPLLK